MSEDTMIVMVIGSILLVIICSAMLLLFGDQKISGLQLERWRMIEEEGRVKRLEETVAKYSALHALGSELKPHEYEELRTAYNELYTTGLPSENPTEPPKPGEATNEPDLNIEAPALHYSRHS